MPGQYPTPNKNGLSLASYDLFNTISSHHFAGNSWFSAGSDDTETIKDLVRCNLITPPNSENEIVLRASGERFAVYLDQVGGDHPFDDMLFDRNEYWRVIRDALEQDNDGLIMLAEADKGDLHELRTRHSIPSMGNAYTQDDFDLVRRIEYTYALWKGAFDGRSHPVDRRGK